MPLIRGRYKNEYAPLRSVMIHIPNKGELSSVSAKKAMFVQIPDPEKVDKEIRDYIHLLERLGIKVYTDNVLTYPKLYPNQIFLRDIGVFLSNCVLVANPKYEIRKGERENFKLFLQHIKYSRQIIEIPDDITFEGADLLMLEEKKVAVSAGNRTSLSFIKWFENNFPDYMVMVVPAIPEGIPQHLLGSKMIVGKDLLVSRTTLQNDNLGFTNIIPLEENREVKEKLSSNVLVIGPCELVMPDDCYETKKIFERYGIKCHVSPMTEIRKMAGGFACMTLIMERECE